MVLPVDGSAHIVYNEVTAIGLGWAVTSFYLSFSWRTKEITAIMTMQNAKISCHVTITAIN